MPSTLWQMSRLNQVVILVCSVVVALPGCYWVNGPPRREAVISKMASDKLIKGVVATALLDGGPIPREDAIALLDFKEEAVRYYMIRNDSIDLDIIRMVVCESDDYALAAIVGNDRISKDCEILSMLKNKKNVPPVKYIREQLGLTNHSTEWTPTN